MTGLTSFTGGHGSCSCLLTGVNTVRNAKTLTSVDQQLAAITAARRASRRSCSAPCARPASAARSR
jgi:hypothetical protein